MLTISSLKSSSQAVDYYSNYYIQSNVGQGEWFGKGAKLLGLEGSAKLTDFVNALEGQLSSDINMPATTKHRRPGYDLTFSAPKSVSILALIGQENSILEAHRQAVDRTLDYLSKNFAATRVKSKGKIVIDKTDNLLIVKFEHIESRALDPELHTHAIVMNATRRSDSKWRTLYFDPVYDNKMLLGVIYRGELAQALMKLGYEITQISEKGLFELKDFPTSMIKLFSKRREQIIEELKQQGFSSSKAAQIANFSTRDSKVKINSKQLKSAWDQELTNKGFSLNEIQKYIDKAKERGSVTPANPYALAVQAVITTSKNLADWHGVFTIKQLIKHAGWFNISNCSPDLLEKAVAERFKSGELLYLQDDLYTTQSARDLEIVNILNMRQGKGKVLPMLSVRGANYLTQNATDLKERQVVLKKLLTNTDQQIAVTAKNATNYLDAMKAFVELVSKCEFKPIGITQTNKRKEEFKEELGLNRSQTIEGFLISCSNRADKMKQQSQFFQPLNSKQIWILDFYSKISASQLNALQSYAKQFGTKIIWANRSDQPQVAISALIKHGIQEICLDNQKSKEHVSALMCYPKLNHEIELDHSHIHKNNWQQNTANALVHWSIVKHQQYDAVFPLKKVQLDLFSLGITVPKEILQQELDREIQRSLITVQDGLVTTKNNLALEQACIQWIIKHQKIISPIAINIDLSQQLTKGQQRAINLVLTTSDRVVGIQGVAGSGKTTMLRSLHKLCKEHDFSIIGITPTTSAKERLQQGSKNLTSPDLLLQAGIKAMTVRKFLIKSEKLLNIDPNLAQIEYGSNKLLILDEASFVSTAEMFAILTKVEQLNTRLLIMGDYRQLSSVEAGRIFYLMLGSNMRSVAMTENVRFKQAKTLNIMQDLYKNQIGVALQKLDDSLQEIPNHQERLMKMVELYVAKTPEERRNTILITPEHVDRKLVNNAIRQGLQQNGELVGVKVDCHNLTQVKLTKAEQQKIYYFKEQDLVTFSKLPYGSKIKTNQYYLIKYKDLDQQTLLLEDPNTKQQVVWDPSIGSQLQVYRQEVRELMNNEQIRWLKNNENHFITNGQIATIRSIDHDGNAIVLLDHGKEIGLNFKELNNQHWDYAYAATTFVAQGQDKQTTIALAKGGYTREVLTKEIKINDVLMIHGKTFDLNNNPSGSKLVKVMSINNKDYSATTRDRDGNTMLLDLKKSPSNAYSKGQAIWQSYPDPTTRKGSMIPKLTSVEELLVSVTRGDQVTLLVDHIESYQHALEQKLYNARSALELLDPRIHEIRAKVEQMTKNIRGLAANSENSANVINTSKLKSSFYQKSSFITIEEVIDKLQQNILQQTTDWLGKPQTINNQEARWGKKGSLVVKLSGDKAGFWHDFEQGAGGKNLLSLYMKLFNLDFKKAIQELSKNLGIDSEQKLFNRIKSQNKPQSSKSSTLEFKNLKYVNKFYNSCCHIPGTLAEKYLREFRGITRSIPKDFRFFPKLRHPDLKRFLPGLVAPIKNAHNQIQGLVRIFLNPDGHKLNYTYLDQQGSQRTATVKANLGSMVNGAVIINPGSHPQTMYIAEGIETALSISEITKSSERVVAALSVTNLKNVPIPLDVRKVVLCADYDGVNARSSQAVLTAANKFKERGLDVTICYPEKIPGLQKRDFNDVLRHLGKDSIAKSLQNSTSVNLELAENIKSTATVNFKSIEKQSDQEICL